MARQPKDVKISGAFISPTEQAGWVRTSPTKAVPSQLRATIYLDEPQAVVQMFITVGAGARAEVREIAVAPRERDDAVSNSLLRKIPVDFLMRAVLKRAAVAVTDRGDVQRGAFQLPSDPEYQAWVSPTPPPESGRGLKASPERVREAARVYREALAAGSQAPGMEVAKTLGYSRATAARDIRLARSQGLLPAEDGTQTAADVHLDAPPAALPAGPVWRDLGQSDTWRPLTEWTEPGGAMHAGVPLKEQEHAEGDDQS